jgi:acyl carrier protein
MELNDFIKNFAEQFDDTDIEEFKADTNLRDLEEWSSLNALSVISMVDDEYDVTLKGDDIVKSNTIEDLYNLIKSRL